MNHYDDINLKLGRAAAGRSFKHVVAVIHEGGEDPIDKIEYGGEIIALNKDKSLKNQLEGFIYEHRSEIADELSYLSNDDLMDIINHGVTYPVVITVKDAVDYDDFQLNDIIMAAHHSSQKSHKVLFIVSGPETLMGLMGEIRPYAERLFDFLHMEKPESSVDPEP